MFLIVVLILSIGHGFEFLYIARSITRIQTIVTGLTLIRFLYGFKINTIFKNVFPPLICGLLMSDVGYGVKLINNGILWQFVCIAICIIVYFSALFILFTKMRKEIFDFPFVKKY